MLKKLLISLYIIVGFLYSGLVYSVGSYTNQLAHLLDELNNNSLTSNNNVTVILESSDLNVSIRQSVRALGGHFYFHSGNHHELRLTAKKLQQLLKLLPSGVHVRLPYPHKAVAVTSEGVGIIGANDMHALSNTGVGVKVGIIDLGFTSYSLAQSTGDLPANLIITDYSGTGTDGTTHGTNVAEIIYDMAPDADFYLAKIATSLQLEQAMNDMLAAGVKVINHSVGWFGAAFYDGTGVLCDIADAAEVGAMQWVNAAGNSRTDHYLGTFSDTDADLRHEFSTYQNFNSIDLTSGSAITLVLNWDAYPATDIDYNLYLYDADPDAGGVLVASSENIQNGVGTGDSPYEAISYTPVITATHYIVVKKASSSTLDIPLTLFSLGPSLNTRTTASSLVQPADCNSVLSVGAVDLLDGVEWFSSEGPTTDGRNKPEVSATNRTITSLTSSFAGTSAASPHVAGAAVLLLAQNALLTTVQLRDLLITDSYDVNTLGFDFRSGSGRISLDADLDTYNHDDDNCVLLTNVDQADLDLDGLGDVCDADIDGDGLLNIDETNLGTNSYNPDSDADGLIDGDEVYVYFTNPLLLDTDLDGLSDGDEVLVYSTDPNASNIGDLAPRYAPDNLVNTADLLILFRLIEQLDTATVYEQTVGDINLDGVLDIRDTLQLRRDLGF